MRVLVTGGGGFVGRPLCSQLVQEHEVLVLDSFRFGRQRVESPDLAGVEFVELDLLDAEAVASEVRRFRPDAILHLAAIHYIPECEQNPTGAFATNVRGTVNLLASCPENCRFLFVSSAAVYQPSLEPHREDDPVVATPGDLYGLTKLHGEHYTRYFARERGFAATIVRLFNVIGPGETNPHLLPEIAAQLEAGRRRIELGNLTPRRDYLHVLDAAYGFAQLAVHGCSRPGEVEIYNLGRGQSWSVEDVVKAFSDALGEEVEIVVDQDRVRKVDRPNLCADHTRLARVLGWAPERTLVDAVQDLWSSLDLPPELRRRYST